MKHVMAALLGLLLLPIFGFADGGVGPSSGLAIEDVVLIKLGGSSITDKATKEKLNITALEWISRTIAAASDESFLSPVGSSDVGAAGEKGSACTQGECQGIEKKRAFVIVHGAGSFGHHVAREFGLSGQSDPPQMKHMDTQQGDSEKTVISLRRTMAGLAQTRLSVQKLNKEVVSSLVDHGINAVGISPCISVPRLQAHGGNENGGVTALVEVVRDALDAGLVPVIHGDACLYGQPGSMGAGILGGDTIIESMGTDPALLRLSQVIFLTDVDGVYTSDPKLDSEAVLLETIEIDAKTGKVMTDLTASGSTHEHDVTGGLETKLGAAAVIAKSGTDVIIVKCMSLSAEQAIRGEEKMVKGTVVRRAS